MADMLKGALLASGILMAIVCGLLALLGRFAMGMSDGPVSSRDLRFVRWLAAGVLTGVGLIALAIWV